MSLLEVELDRIKNQLLQAVSPWQTTHGSWSLVQDIQRTIQEIDRLLQPERRV